MHATSDNGLRGNQGNASMQLMELGTYPEIYADGIGDVQNLGSTIRKLFFTWQKIDGIYQRIVVVSIIRPITTLGQSGALLTAAMMDTPPPVIQAMQLLS
jgi:hypothetical protein